MSVAVAGRAGQELVLGLVGAGPLDLALPLEALREVVPCPPELDALPATAPGLLGAMALRGTVVPVVDLAVVLGHPHERAHGQVVVVLARDGQVLGLLVDEVRGMAALPAADCYEVGCADGRTAFARAVADPSTGRVLSVVDPEVLLALPGVPVVREQTARTGTVAAASRSASHALTVVRCGAFALALDVAAVHSTVPAPPLSPSPVDGPLCLGVTPVAGHDVGAVDLLALLGLGDSRGGQPGCGLVLDLPDGQVVLAVGAMVGLFEVPGDAVVPLPAAASPSPSLLTRVAEVPGVGACLVVDGEQLRRVPDVVALSRVTTPSAADETAAAASRAVATGPAHLAYAAGTLLATPLDQVVEVLPSPSDLVPSAGAAHVLGVTLHRGTAVPVVDLADVLHLPAPPLASTSRLLLVAVDGEPVAYAVTSLHAILPLAWTDPSPARPAEGSSLLRRCPLVQLDALEALVPVLDLHALTRALRGTPVADVPAARAAHEPVPVA